MISFLPPFLLGFLATSYQILLLREFSAYFYGNELTYGIVLASWLLWGSIGSMAASRMRLQPQRFPRLYLAVAVLLPVSLLGLRFSRFLFRLAPGELSGLTPVFFLSFGVCLLVSFPLGVLFVFNVSRSGGRIERVFILESLGAAVGGIIIHAAVLPFISHWQAVSLIGGLTALLVAVSFGKKQLRAWWILVFAALGAFSLLDLPSQRMHWSPFLLVASRDSLHGKLQMIRNQEQLSLYSNGAHIYSYPDAASAEEAVHFAMLQSPEAQKVLLVGGGAGGSLGEILKYPRAEADYVELDPEIIELSRRYLPAAETEALRRERVRVYSTDGRAYLQKSSGKYDVIILNLPDPSTALVNRFFTREFFSLAESRLSPGGVFSFGVSSAENYIGPELRQFLSSLYFTLADVFPVVKIVPGERNIFLASSRDLTVSPEALVQKIREFGLNNRYVSAAYLFSRLHPLRQNNLADQVLAGPRKINLDLVPVSFFFSSVLWSSQFSGFEKSPLVFISRLRPIWLTGCPLAIFFLASLFFRIKKRRSAYFLAPLVVMGLTTIVVEITVLIWYQARYGYLYGRIALLLSSFMLGLFLGSLTACQRKKHSLARLTSAQFGFVVFLFLLLIIVRSTPPEFLSFVLLFLMGGLSGEVFIVSNTLYLREKINYGLGYGLDLAGSFGGALVTSSILIPLAGLAAVFFFVFLLNTLCLIFLIARPKNL